jgi:hypothetical protein
LFFLIKEAYFYAASLLVTSRCAFRGIGTLVVAVAAFYFGSRSVESAVSALAAGQRLPPVIEHVDPSKGDLGTDRPLTITGRNFRSPTVKLVSAANNKEIVSKGNPLSNDTTINCTMTLGSVTDTDMIGDWALLVVNDDGQKHQLEKAFEITKPATNQA